jgi:protein-tyrosine-phosphatase
MEDEMTRVAFVCVENAGRSQMAAAFAEATIDPGAGSIEVISGGTAPAATVHPEVVSVMQEVGIDLSPNEPRSISRTETATADIVVTMGCSAEGICPAHWDGDSRDWDLPDPKGKPIDVVRDIRDQIQQRVQALLTEIDAGGQGREV